MIIQQIIEFRGAILISKAQAQKIFGAIGNFFWDLASFYFLLGGRNRVGNRVSSIRLRPFFGLEKGSLKIFGLLVPNFLGFLHDALDWHL